MRRFFEKNIVPITLIPVLAVMITIFCFSAEDKDSSDVTSGRLTSFVISLLHPEFDALDAEAQTLLYDRTSFFVRKAAHFSEFAALGFFLLGHFRALALKKSLRRPTAGAAVTGFLYAVSDELHQFFVGGRSPKLLDVGIDSAGVLFGILVMALLLLLGRAGRKK